MKKEGLKILAMALILTMGSLLITEATAAEAPGVTKEELKGMLSSPDVVIIDVRLGRDWNASDSKIKGAVREDPIKLNEWIGKYLKDKILVFYCA